MKYTIFLLLFALFTVSCSEDDVKEITTVTRDFSVTETLEVSIGESDPLSYSTSKTLDASLSGFDISNIEVVSVTAEITSVLLQGGATNLVEATFELAGTGIVLTMEDVDLSNAVGTTFEFNLDATALAALESALTTAESLTINTSATVDNKPVDFTLELVLELTATGSVL